MSVCAVVTGPAPEGQTHEPDHRVAADQGTAAALATRATWFWLLDGSATPGPRALELLLEPLGRLGPLPEPVLLASRLRGGGESEWLPVPRLADPELTVAAFERRLLPVRIARGGSLLVRRRAVEAFGLPVDTLHWTARLLKHESGLLVPASVAIRSVPAPADLGARLRLLGSGALRRREKALFALRLSGGVVAVGRRVPRAR